MLHPSLPPLQNLPFASQQHVGVCLRVRPRHTPHSLRRDGSIYLVRLRLALPPTPHWLCRIHHNGFASRSRLEQDRIKRGMRPAADMSDAPIRDAITCCMPVYRPHQTVTSICLLLPPPSALYPSHTRAHAHSQHTHAHVHARTRARAQTCTCAHVHAHTQARVRTHTHTHMCMHARTHTRAHMRAHTHPCMHARTNARTHTHTHTHAHKHIHTHTHMHTHTNIHTLPHTQTDT